MRRRIGLTKAADGNEADSGTHRLTDIEVREVSVVDRPANRRKFLVVKHESAKSEGKVAAMKLTAKSKVELAQVLKGIVEAAGGISKSVDAAEVADGVEVPAQITTALQAVGKLVNTVAPVAPPADDPAPVTKSVCPECDASMPASAKFCADCGASLKKAPPAAKAGRKLSQARQEKLRAAYAKLEEVISEVADPEPETPAATPVTAFETAKGAPATTPPAAPAAPAADPAILAALKEMNSTISTLTKAVGIQKERLDKVAGSSGSSSQQVIITTEKAAADASREADISWPLDMNRPITRDTTPVGKSFFATR